MSKTMRSFVLLAAGLALTVPALADEVRREGVIVSKNDQGVAVRTKDGPLNVVVTPGTTIKLVKGLSKKERNPDALMPGLIIQIQGDQRGDTIRAERIEFKDRDWRAAVATHAGTAEQFEKAAAERAELRQAIIEGQEYVIREEAVVYFPSGSAVVGESFKQALRQLAGKAPSYGNYRISILGFADPRGDAAANERLSLRRAMAVSNFLRQTGHIQPGRVLSPSAMGEGTQAPGEAAPTSNDEARRVVVRVVTPKTQLQK